jgi:dTDP-4-amino-4,6-dideoxygalactose transaminase
VLIESEPDHTMDLRDMEAKIKANPRAKFMLVSHMRGKLCDMDAVKAMCEKHGLTMVEDCAHSIGVFWGDTHTGHHAEVACFSCQAHKAINSGEGGFLCTSARARLCSAACCLYVVDCCTACACRHCQGVVPSPAHHTSICAMSRRPRRPLQTIQRLRPR